MGKAVKIEEGTLALINVGRVKNVKALRRKVGDKYDWSFSPVPELGLKVGTATDNEVEVVKILDVEGVPNPESKTYNVSDMSAIEIHTAINIILGENEEDYGEYYRDYTGANGFWHILAQTQKIKNPNDRWPGGIEVPEGVEVVANGVVNIRGIGQFKRIEITNEYDETGDLDYEMIFQIDGDPRYFQIETNLDSWSGGLWDGVMKEVKPVIKTITVWE